MSLGPVEKPYSTPRRRILSAVGEVAFLNLGAALDLEDESQLRTESTKLYFCFES